MPFDYTPREGVDRYRCHEPCNRMIAEAATELCYGRSGEADDKDFIRGRYVSPVEQGLDTRRTSVYVFPVPGPAITIAWPSPGRSTTDRCSAVSPSTGTRTHGRRAPPVRREIVRDVDDQARLLTAVGRSAKPSTNHLLVEVRAVRRPRDVEGTDRGASKPCVRTP